MPHWYVVHTYSGYENKVKTDIEKTIENRRLQNQMFDVMVPMQDVTETQKTVPKGRTEEAFPRLCTGAHDQERCDLVCSAEHQRCYRLRRTGIRAGASYKEEEMRKLGVRIDEYVIDVEVGDSIQVHQGAWEGTVGKVKAINQTKQTVTIEIDIFGRSTDVEIGFSDIPKL